jgi:hypothetical protein
MKKLNASLVILLFMLSACNAVDEPVEIITNNIFTPISFTVMGSEVVELVDFDEYVVDSGEFIITVYVKNNTDFDMTSMSVEFVDKVDDIFDFAKNGDGGVEYPGFQGTCGTTLSANSDCTIQIAMETAISGNYLQEVIFHYNNLVEPDNRETSFKVLAGVPASLVYNNGLSTYSFGDKVGSAEIPIVERSEVTVFSKDLVIKNGGELRARNISGSLTNTCLSTLDATCPVGMDGGYTYTHNCPTVLYSGQTCSMHIDFTPKNQNFSIGPTPDNIKEIRYDGLVRFDYHNTPQLNTAALNGYFTSTSTTIQAMFETSIDSVLFEVPIVVGNRAQKTFKINNNGYSDGILHKLILTDAESGLHVATCKGGIKADDLLTCYNEAEDTELTLEEFPFFVTDRNDCFNEYAEAQFRVPIETGCIMDLNFQPSITYTSSKIFAYEVKAEFDSLWKEQETIIQNELHSAYADSLSAAKISITKMKINSIEKFPYLVSGDSLEYDLGRLALLSANFYQLVEFSLTFSNTGDVPATNITFKDGANIVIPMSADNPSGIDLGPHAGASPKLNFYQGFIANSTTCEIIVPGGSCIIKANFAPIGLTTTQMEYENMFDYIDEDDPINNYKYFDITYDDGASYDDLTLISTVRDIPARSADAKVKATLVMKGYLGDYKLTNNFTFSSDVTSGNISIHQIKIQNIGTGPIPYFKWRGELESGGLEMIPTDDLFAAGADYDCMDVIDFDFVYNTDSFVDINARSANWQGLPKEKTCVFTLELAGRVVNDSVIDQIFTAGYGSEYTGGYVFEHPLDLSFKERGTDFVRETEGTREAWPFNSFSFKRLSLLMDYFDGDTSDPLALAETYGGTYGNLIVNPTSNPYTYEVNGAVNAPGQLMPVSVMPQTSAIIYREGFTLPALTDDYGELIRVSETLPADIYWSQTNITAYDALVADAVKADYNKTYFLANTLGNIVGLENYEHVIDLGTMPVGVNINLSFKLVSLEGVSPRLDHFKLTQSGTEFTLNNPELIDPLPADIISVEESSVASVVLPESASIGGGLNISITFNSSAASVGTNSYEAVLEYGYQTGAFVDPYADPLLDPTQKRVEKKILILARAEADAPNIEVDTYDYDIESNDGLPPTETLIDTPIAQTLGYNENIESDSKIILTSVKISDPTVNDFYVKKKVVIKNSSVTKKMWNLKFDWRTSVLAGATLSPHNGESVQIDQSDCSNLDGTAAPFINTRTGNELPSLDEAGGLKDSCEIIIWYQPVTGSLLTTLSMNFTYEVKEDQYIQKHFTVELEPRDPATFIPSSSSLKPISDENGNTLQSYPLAFGTIEFTEDPHKISFDQEVSTFKKVTLINPTATRASFIKAYHEYLTLEGGTPLIEDYPSAGDYFAEGGEMVTTIFKTKYDNGDDRIVVNATEECLKGDDEGLPHFQQGVNTDSVLPCVLIFHLYADINYIGRTISPVSAVDMNGNYIRIPFYNNERSSLDWITFHFEGRINPNSSITGGAPHYTEVTAVEDRIIEFEWDTMSVDNIDLGLIVGYRVFQSDSPVPLADPLSTSVEFVDTLSREHRVDTGLVKGKYYFFTIVPIRQYSAYTFGKFPSLPVGQYLSVSDIEILEVVVPLTDTFYDYEQQIIVSKELKEFGLVTWESAKTSCSSSPQEFLNKSGSLVAKGYELITSSVWDTIAADHLNNTNYAGYNTIAHWINGAMYSLDTVLSGSSEYDNTQGTQTLYTDEVFYIRRAGCPTCSLPMTKGGATANPAAAGFTSYVDGDIPYAMARCYIPL